MPLFDRLLAFFRSAPLTRGEIGRKGESAAQRLLGDKGFRIVERNWRKGKDEIDLICLDGAALVFVEVRSRAFGALVGGYDSIDDRKRKAIRRVCRAYLAGLRPRPKTTRLDVVEIEHLDGSTKEIRHFENVPLFSKTVNRDV